MKIKIFITGGTIDCQKINPKTKQYIFRGTHIPQMLEQGRCRIETDLETLMLKDSLHITDADRELILEKCKKAPEDKIVITHGTDTMVETAQVLGKNIKNKTLVLCGAMIPFVFENSDALFNLGAAITAVQILPKGVYITMNGKIFTYNNVKKDKKLGEFKVLKENPRTPK